MPRSESCGAFLIETDDNRPDSRDMPFTACSYRRHKMGNAFMF